MARYFLVYEYRSVEFRAKLGQGHKDLAQVQFVAMAPRRIPHRASRPDTALAALCYCALCCCAIATLAAAQQAPRYRVRAARLNGGEPVLSSATGTCGFNFCFNPAALRLPNGSLALLVRVSGVNTSAAVQRNGPSRLALTAEVQHNGEGLDFWPPTEESVVFERRLPDGSLRDVEDPRVVYRQAERLYYVWYTLSGAEGDARCGHAAEGAGDRAGTLSACLALATTPDPANASAWVDHGAIFRGAGGYQWTKSGAVIERAGTEADPHVMAFGSWNTLTPEWVSPIYMPVAYSADMRRWSVSPTYLLERRATNGTAGGTRTAYPDGYLVEPGPPPLRLADGNYLMLYNGATRCDTAVASYKRCYHLLWAILDGGDPTVVLARAHESLLDPEMPWEGADFNASAGVAATPNVVFVEGLVPWGKAREQSHRQIFRAYYGGGDAAVGALEVIVEVEEHGGSGTLAHASLLPKAPRRGGNARAW